MEGRGGRKVDRDELHPLHSLVSRQTFFVVQSGPMHKGSRA